MLLEMAFKISISDCSLLVYRTIIKFVYCLLSATLLNSHCFSSFFVDFYQIFYIHTYIYIMCKKRAVLLFHSQSEFFFLALLHMPQPPVQAILDRNYKSRHPCLVPNLREKAFIPLLLSIISVVGFSYLPFIRGRKLLFSPSLQRILIMKGCWSLPNGFFVCFLAFFEIILCYYGFFIIFYFLYLRTDSPEIAPIVAVY